jgi:hypothetical protein
MEEHDKDNEKQPGDMYESPKLVRVTLRPEEAVLGHCKVTGSAGPGPGGCRGVPVFCRVPGS